MKSPAFETTSLLYVTPTDSSSMQELLYPRPTKLGGGGWGGGILDSPCPSVRPSVRPSVDDMVSGA